MISVLLPELWFHLLICSLTLLHVFSVYLQSTDIWF